MVFQERAQEEEAAAEFGLRLGRSNFDEVDYIIYIVERHFARHHTAQALNNRCCLVH